VSEEKNQLDKFKEAARQLETDDDEERFEERLKIIVTARKDNDVEFSNYSDSGLRELHEACRRAYESDRSEEERINILGQAFSFGVNESTDWPRHVRGLEAEMQKRDLDFIPVDI